MTFFPTGIYSGYRMGVLLNIALSLAFLAWRPTWAALPNTLLAAFFTWAMIMARRRCCAR